VELKKYVLLSDNIIVDVSKENYYLTQKGLIRYRENAVMQKTLMGTVKSTSDNILDLVEVGDLVGYRFWGDSFLGEDCERIDKMHDEQNIENEIKHNGNGFVIIAIYKRQSNGDYKRYEVENNGN